MYLNGSRGYSPLCLFTALFKAMDVYVWEERSLSVMPCSLHCSRVWIYGYGMTLYCPSLWMLEERLLSHRLCIPLYCSRVWIHGYGMRSYHLIYVHCIVQGYGSMGVGWGPTILYMFIALFKGMEAWVWAEVLPYVILCSWHCSRIRMHGYGMRPYHVMLCSLHCSRAWMYWYGMRPYHLIYVHWVIQGYGCIGVGWGLPSDMLCSLQCSRAWMHGYGMRSYHLIYVHCIVQGYGSMSMEWSPTICYTVLIALFKGKDAWIWDEAIPSAICSLRYSRVWMHRCGMRPTIWYAVFIAVFKGMDAWVWDEAIPSAICSLHCSRVWKHGYGMKPYHMLYCAHCIVQG